MYLYSNRCRYFPLPLSPCLAKLSRVPLRTHTYLLLRLIIRARRGLFFRILFVHSCRILVAVVPYIYYLLTAPGLFTSQTHVHCLFRRLHCWTYLVVYVATIQCMVHSIQPFNPTCMSWSSWSVSVPYVSAEDIHPEPDLRAARARPAAPCQTSSDVHARAALVAANLAVLLDLVHHLLREPNGKRLLARHLDDGLRPGYNGR